MMRSMLAGLALTLFLPFTVAAQQTPAQRIEAALATATRAGIPVELLQNRIAEGRAKGVSEQRIAEAVERRTRGLAEAREAMVGAGLRPSAAELSSGADALEAGVNAEALRAVIQAARAEDRPVAIAVLGELVRQGVPVQEARDRVRAALQRREGNLADLPRRAAAERAAARQDGARGATTRPAGGRQPGDAVGAAGSQGGRPAGVPATGRPSGAGNGNGQGNGRGRN